MINENLIFKHCPAILASSLEFRDMKASKTQEECLKKLKTYEDLKELLPKDQKAKTVVDKRTG
jgi:hypothetical protein